MEYLERKDLKALLDQLDQWVKGVNVAQLDQLDQPEALGNLDHLVLKDLADLKV